MCYFHLKQACERKLKELNTSKNVTSKILNDLDILRLTPYQYVFEKLWSDAKKSWKTLSQEFFIYFEREYMNSKRLHWNFSHINGTIPNTNNALEGFNRSLKYNSTSRIALAFPNFLRFLEKEIEYRSRLTSFFVKRPIIKEPLAGRGEPEEACL